MVMQQSCPEMSLFFGSYFGPAKIVGQDVDYMWRC